jgi:hypothetical protein
MKEPSSKFKKQSSKLASNKNSGKASKDKKLKEAPLTSSGKSMGFSTNINSIQSDTNYKEVYRINELPLRHGVRSQMKILKNREK